MENIPFELIYASVVRRESTYDGIYYTAVKSTKIVCRPSCRAKTPKAANVTFYSSLEAAVREGYRPCKRCKPEANGQLNPDAAMAAQLDAIIASRYGQRLVLDDLAAMLAVSSFHLQRVYKRERGCSPTAKLEKMRLQEAKNRLLHSAAPISAIGAAVGYRSASYFSAWFLQQEGLSPTEYRKANNGGVLNGQG